MIGATFEPERTLQDLERMLKINMMIEMMYYYYPLYIFAAFYEWAFKIEESINNGGDRT